MKHSEYLLTLRSKTTFKTETYKLRIFPDQDPQVIAKEQADSYGATVEELVLISEWIE